MAAADEEAREVGPVRRGPADVGRPDTGEEGNAHAVSNRRGAPATAAYHRLFRMASLPPRPTRLSVTGTPFLRLPRHPRPLPLSGSRPARPRRRRGRHDGLDRARRPGAARHRCARGPRALARAAEFPRPWLLGGDRRLRRADRRQRDPELGRRRHGGGQARPTSPCSRSEPPRSSTRGSDSPTRAWFLVAFCTVAVAWGAVEFVVNGRQAAGVVPRRARPGGALDDGARLRARAPLRAAPAAAAGRARRDRRRRARDRRSARRWRACSASTSRPRR